MDFSQRARAILSFVYVADRGSFSAAAKALGISSAAVSKNVVGLESALGVRLLNRTTRSLKLTTEGEIFLERARLGIDVLDEAVNAVSVQKGEVAGKVRISASNAFGRRFLLPLIPNLQEQYPSLVVELDLEDRLVDLIRDGYDLALRGGTFGDSSLISRRICQLHSVLVASKEYLERRGTPREPMQLDKHSLIAVRFLNGQLLNWVFSEGSKAQLEYVPVKPILTVSAANAAADAALLGMGIAQVGLFDVWDHIRSGHLKILLPRHHVVGSRELTLQYPHRALIAPRVRATVDYLVTELSSVEALQVDPKSLKEYWAH